jgi:hypothetical protein
VFLGLVCLLQIVGLNISHNGNALMLSFGEPSIKNVNSSDMDAIIASAIDKYAESQNNQLAKFQDQVNEDLGALNSAVNQITISNETTISELKYMFKKNLNEQYVGLQSMIKDSEANQMQELEDSFTGLVQFIDDYRITDQVKIQNAFSDIATAINNQQYQTNALLTSFSAEEPSLKSY